jgi:hypothetical protein
LIFGDLSQGQTADYMSSVYLSDYTGNSNKEQWARKAYIELSATVHHIGIVHANNRLSNTMYGLFAYTLNRHVDHYLSGIDKGLLMRAVWEIQDGHLDKALQLLQHPRVLANSTQNDFSKRLRSYITDRLSLISNRFS